MQQSGNTVWLCCVIVIALPRTQLCCLIFNVIHSDIHRSCALASFLTNCMPLHWSLGPMRALEAVDFCRIDPIRILAGCCKRWLNQGYFNFVWNSRRHLRSASQHHLTVRRHRLSTFGRRAFSVAGPTVWNSLPDSLRDPALSSDRFQQLLKTNLFRHYNWVHTAQ